MSSEAARDRIQVALDHIDARIDELSAAPEVLSVTAWQLSLPSSDAAAELAALKVQRSVWNLLGLMADEVVVDDDPLPTTVSHRDLLDEITRRSPMLQRAQSVVLWSEEEHRRQYEDERLSVPIDWGTPYAQTLAQLGPGHHLHPDAADSQLHPDDARAEARFWRGVWQLVAGGMLSRADPELHLPSAMQLCQAFGHEWRTVSLAGALPFHVAGDAVEGNWHRWLWRHTCRQMATSPGTSASQWERAVYGLLAGDVRHVYPVCETWQEFAWATSACWVVLAQDADLHAHLRQTLDPRTSEPLDDERFVERPAQATLDDLMRQCESAYAEARPGSVKDSYHRVIKYLALDDLQHVYDELFVGMTEPESAGNRVYHHATYIEFAFRLYLALNPEPERDDHNARIVVEYIRYLGGTHDLQHLIPEAVAVVPDPVKVDEYAVVLRACTNAATRDWFLSQAEARFARDVVRSIHQRLLTLITPAVLTPGPDAGATVDVVAARDNIDDLVSCQSLDVSAATRQANVFFREFFAADQFDNALRLFREFRRPPPSDSYTDDERELMCWLALIKARTKISDLERYLTKRPAPMSPGTVQECLDELQFGSAATALGTWEDTRDDFFEIARRAVLNVVRFQGGWMRFDDADRGRLLGSYRQICVPDLVTRVFAVCEAMEARHMGTCLDLVVAIADQTTRAFEAFDSDRLRSLIMASRHVYLKYVSATA